MKVCDFVSTALIPIVGLAMYAVFISLLQEKLIYMPRQYNGQHSKYYRQRRQQASALLTKLGSTKIIDLPYSLLDGTPQTAYFLAPIALHQRKKKRRGATTPKNNNNDDDKLEQPFQLWMAASGNAGLALDWLDLSVEFMQHRSQSTSSHGFLLVDYPGYGSNAGDPSPSTILESSTAALTRLDAYLNKQYATVSPDYVVSYVAHSIGCSAVLQHAVALLRDGRPVDRIVLVSPFTTMVEMASLALPLPIPGISYLLRHGWDNIERMKEIGVELRSTGWVEEGEGKEGMDAVDQSSGNRLTLTIIHGNVDEIVPVEMGRKVHAAAVQASKKVGGSGKNKRWKVRFREIKNADHNRILDQAKQTIFKAMRI